MSDTAQSQPPSFARATAKIFGPFIVLLPLVVAGYVWAGAQDESTFPGGLYKDSIVNLFQGATIYLTVLPFLHIAFARHRSADTRDWDAAFQSASPRAYAVFTALYPPTNSVATAIGFFYQTCGVALFVAIGLALVAIVSLYGGVLGVTPYLHLIAFVLPLWLLFNGGATVLRVTGNRTFF